MRRILMLIALCAWTISACAQESGPVFEEGVHYSKVTVEPAPPGKVEVIEFFSYTCPHCASFAPHIQSWEKKQKANVKVTYIPVVFHETLLNYAKAHYALEILGAADKGKALIFEAIHVKNDPLDTPEKIADLMAPIGVDKKKLLETMDSFAVDNSVRLGLQRTQKYRISGVPSIAINGKYLTSVGMGGGDEGVLKVMDYLVQLETKNRAKPAAQKEKGASAAAATSAPAAGSK
jgi:thiol:disulfide interchange protein DsbA